MDDLFLLLLWMFLVLSLLCLGGFIHWAWERLSSRRRVNRIVWDRDVPEWLKRQAE